MSETELNEHAWFREQIAAALLGGLDAAERVRFEAHVAECEACAAELKANAEMERHMSGLFALPAAGLEDRIIDSLRMARANWRLRVHVHPAVRRAVTGVAAAIVVAAVGYAVNQQLQEPPRQVAAGRESNGRVPSYVDRFPATRPFGNDARFRANLGAEFAVAGDVDGDKERWFKSGHGTVYWDTNGAYEQPAAPATPTMSGANRFGGATVVNGGTLSLGGQSGGGGAMAGSVVANSSGGVLDLGSVANEGKNVIADLSTNHSVARGSTVNTDEHVDFYFKPTQLALGDSGDRAGKELGAKRDSVELQFERQVEQQVAAVAAVPVTPAPPPAEQKPPAEPARAAEVTGRKIIRSGQMEFEVDRYDAAFAQVSKLTIEAGGYVGTTDSEKLPNGKVKGTVTLRVPPERLDTLVLQLRGIGDLKSQKLDANDITKQYTDIESELRAARAMEERLLAIIKEGKGQIKDLLAAEKELGTWRTKIEKLVGETRFYDNQVAMSTLVVSLFERDIKTPAAAQQTETIDAGLESADVETARMDALKAIEDAKGRVVQSDLKRFDAGQFGATIVAEVPPDNAGPLLDRLKQIGKIARLDIQRKQTTDANADSNAPLRVEKKNTRLQLSLYNLANVAPRISSLLNLAADDVESTYRAIIERVNRAGGRVVGSNLAKNKPEQTTGSINFEVPSADADAVVNDLRSLGEVMRLSVSENPDVQNVTTAKRGFALALVATASVPPRETASVQIASAKVSEARDNILSAASGGKARVLTSQLNESDRSSPNATLELEVPRGSLAAMEKVLADVGDTISRVVTRSPDAENTLDTKVKLQITLLPADKMAPREGTAMMVETHDVDGAMATLSLAVSQAGGRVVESNLSKERNGATVGRLAFEVPLAQSNGLIDEAKKQGVIRAVQRNQNLQVPAGNFAKARVDLQLVTPDTLVEAGSGPWARIRQGLATSLKGLLWSLELIVVGVCFVLPFVLLLWGGWKLLKRSPKLRGDVGAGAA